MKLYIGVLLAVAAVAGSLFATVGSASNCGRTR